jgi:PadR family transcriptional regulator PadR
MSDVPKAAMQLASPQRFEEELTSSRRSYAALVLLALAERADHGYGLMERLKPVVGQAPGRVYRALNWLEQAGFVDPRWDTSGIGPARRVYRVLPAGSSALEVAAPKLRRQAAAQDGPESEYVRSRLRSLQSNKQAFTFTVDARLTVRANDEGAARRKLERALAHTHLIDADVRTTGDVSILMSRP